MGFPALSVELLEDVDTANQSQSFTPLHYSFKGVVLAHDMELERSEEPS